MAAEAQQREWIWEFFLKNCRDARMIQELMSALPFPDENLHLKKMLLLRSLSIHSSAGVIDELTLDILRGIGELSKVSGGCTPSMVRKGRCFADSCFHAVAKKRRLREHETNDDELELSIEKTKITPPCLSKGRMLPWNCGGSKGSKRRKGLQTEAGVGETGNAQNDDCVKARAMLKGGGLEALEQTKEIRNERDVRNACTSEETFPGFKEWIDGCDLTGSGSAFEPGQSPLQWELQLAVMAELAVKHLRGDYPDRKLFEHAVTKHWGDYVDNLEGPVLEMARARNQIKCELWLVRRNPELLDDVAEKYNKERVEAMLKTYLDKMWDETGGTFLDKVSADVLSGIYKPVNSNGKRVKKVCIASNDGENGEDQANKTPWIRASRGRFSRSREKLQKRFAILDLDQDDEGEVTAKSHSRDLSKERADDFVGRESDHDRDGDEGTFSVNNTGGADCLTGKEGGEVGVCHSTGGGLGRDANDRIGNRVQKSGVANGVEFETPRAQKRVEEKRQCEEVRETIRSGDDASEAEDQTHLTEDTRTVFTERSVDLTECRPTSCSFDTRRASGACDVMCCCKKRHALCADDERGTEDPGNDNSTELQRADTQLCHKEGVDKENIMPPVSPTAPDPNQNSVCFSPPPWVAGSSVLNVTERGPLGLTREKNSGLVIEHAGAATGGVPAETVPATDSTLQSPDTAATQRNLQRKQTMLDAAVQDPLPNILRPSRVRRCVLERNATARTLEWEEDAIEESPPNSPSASRRVRLPGPVTGHRISPLVVSPKITAENGTAEAKYGRRKPRRWSAQEVDILKMEVGKYGKGRWKLILATNQEIFQGRTEVDLKDKWRNLERFGVKE